MDCQGLHVRFKVVPEPPTSIGVIDEFHAALPLVPANEDTCCARLVARTPVDARDRAREWLTFLRALELVEETDDGYRRLRTDSDLEGRRRAFRERVYLVEEVLDAIKSADEPLPAETVFAGVETYIPAWERLRHDDPGRIWRDRVARMLEWGVRFDLLERVETGYVVTEIETV
ncbi:MAG: hypothetical protein ACOCQ7_02280 [Natronomonas sp.]